VDVDDWGCKSPKLSLHLGESNVCQGERLCFLQLQPIGHSPDTLGSVCPPLVVVYDWSAMIIAIQRLC
jgi:hypothetical protein